ncbi:hypothetical protein IV454_27855 [Massilia antarctica]|uniref:Uncharacterized protein n=1 Tax=Massilia antarctica TaxID=2765360 RepID=A0AA48WCK6_9BURK|nr:hypothetical protein [Massilia antarctica]QPI49228.1 hypothetical protein IV454_27855 [Massilia antarctica]
MKLTQKISRLPFDGGKFFEVCLDRIKFVKKVPQATDKCGPAYYPYVAKKTDPDALVQLIGTHKYIKVGPKFYDAYDNPFANGLHPLFLVFPPLKDVVLVRVDDFDQMDNEERDRFGGAYLAIKNGKVIDQLTDGCIMNAEYACYDLDGTKRYQLLETGKFKKM